jgi:hypothetical protein
MNSMITLTAPQQCMLGALGAALLVLGTNNSAQAGTLFNNGAPDLQLSVRSDFDVPVETGDDFTFFTSSDVKKITWSGLYASETGASTNSASDQFSVRIFEFSSAAPAIAPLVAFDNISVSRSPIDPQNQFFYNYSFVPTQFTLKAGRYLLSVVNNTEANTVLDWAWATSNNKVNNTSVGNNFGRVEPNREWFEDRSKSELSFTIEGDPTSVPTPALLPGLIGLGLSIWRKRRSRQTETD